MFRNEFTETWGDRHVGDQYSRFALQQASGSVQTVQVGNIRVDVLFSRHHKRDRNHGLNLLAKQLKAAKESIDMALVCILCTVINQRAAGTDQARG